eukprot:jgi/Mesvir1/26353/Mv26044-RA.1
MVPSTLGVLSSKLPALQTRGRFPTGGGSLSCMTWANLASSGIYSVAYAFSAWSRTYLSMNGNERYPLENVASLYPGQYQGDNQRRPEIGRIRTMVARACRYQRDNQPAVILSACSSRSG